jgi:hypothetical protein
MRIKTMTGGNRSKSVKDPGRVTQSGEAKPKTYLARDPLTSAFALLPPPYAPLDFFLLYMLPC